MIPGNNFYFSKGLLELEPFLIDANMRCNKVAMKKLYKVENWEKQIAQRCFTNHSRVDRQVITTDFNGFPMDEKTIFINSPSIIINGIYMCPTNNQNAEFF